MGEESSGSVRQVRVALWLCRDATPIPQSPHPPLPRLSRPERSESIPRHSWVPESRNEKRHGKRHPSCVVDAGLCLTNRQKWQMQCAVHSFKVLPPTWIEPLRLHLSFSDELRAQYSNSRHALLEHAWSGFYLQALMGAARMLILKSSQRSQLTTPNVRRWVTRKNPMRGCRR